MASKASFVALYPTDFLADIGHVGNTELGVYWRLLLVYYRDQRPLPFDTDKLRRLAMTFSPEEGKALDTVMSEFFALSTEPDGTRVWRHRRADVEIERANDNRGRRIKQTEAARAARLGKQISVTDRVTTSVTENVTGSSQTENQNQNQKEIKTQSPAACAARSGSPVPADPIADSPRHRDEPVDADKVLFDAGIGLLAESRGAQQARAIVGRLRKNLGTDDALRLIVDARGKTDPAAYLMAAEKRHIVAAKIRGTTGKDVKHLPDGRYYCYPHYYSAEGRVEAHV